MITRNIFLILFIGVAALTIFASTGVISLFVGQHSFVNISGTGNQISCVGCHHHIADEMNNSAIHTNLTCEDCHRYNGTGIHFASGDGTDASTPGNESHAAYVPRCLDCHGGTGVYIGTEFAPPARAFNESGYGTDYSAHKHFVIEANNSDTTTGENEACIACHTNYTCKISYSYFYNINYTLQNWTFSSFAYNGTRNYSIQWIKSGSKHEFLRLSDISCVKCHENIYEALTNGTDGITNEDYLTHAPVEIDTATWNTTNPWNHNRYHYIPAISRPVWVNDSYCVRCHNVKRYADEHPGYNTTYDLGNVTSDTNSTEVHCAEILSCATCHGTGKTKEVIDNPNYHGKGHGASFVDNVAANYARTFNGDTCMGCHEAAVHPSSGTCARCHTSGNATVYIESDPSGYATNT